MPGLTEPPTTIKNALTIISQVYQVAATEWGLEGIRNPVRGVRLPKARPGRQRRLEEDEEARLLEAADQTGQPRLRPLIIFAIETAMRQGEILSIERQHIKGVVVRLSDTKSGKPRDVPLSSRARLP